MGNSLQPQFIEHKNTVQVAGATYLDRLATGNEVPNGSGAGPAVARPGSGAGPAVARPGSDTGLGFRV